MVKNLLCNPGDAGVIPRQGNKTLHAMEQLSATTTEPMHSGPCVPQLERPLAATTEVHVPQLERVHVLQLRPNQIRPDQSLSCVRLFVTP